MIFVFCQIWFSCLIFVLSFMCFEEKISSHLSTEFDECIHLPRDLTRNFSETGSVSLDVEFSVDVSAAPVRRQIRHVGHAFSSPKIDIEGKFEREAVRNGSRSIFTWKAAFTHDSPSQN